MSGLTFTNVKKEFSLFKDLDTIDDTPDFHDPYSDLSLFLSKKIKQELCNIQECKKWSIKLQEELINKITPEFRKQFPKYRLGTSAIKRTWERIHFYSHQIQDQKEALTQDGKLNIHFLIKENLKAASKVKHICQLHPYHFAHKLALKMSECIVTIDGIRPKLDHLTHLIWSMQKHLIPQPDADHKSPYDHYDNIDKLIVRCILDTTAKEHSIPQKELAYRIKESLLYLKEFPNFSSTEKATSTIASLLSEKLYFSSPLNNRLSATEKKSLIHFIRKHINLCKELIPNISNQEMVRRIFALYTLACELPKELPHYQLERAIENICLKKEGDNSSLSSFISAELLLMKNETICKSLDTIKELIKETYEEAINLPQIKGKEKEWIEITIWKTVSESKRILEELPYRIGQKIEEEIARIIIDDPNLSFTNAVQAAVGYFQKAKDLANTNQWDEIENKIHIWTLQGDMIYRSIQLNEESPLLKLISKKWMQVLNCTQDQELNLEQFIGNICNQYLEIYPSLAPYSPQIHLQAWILLKYSWYQSFAKKEESSFDRFIKWHYLQFSAFIEKKNKEKVLGFLEDLCKKILPLVPFDRERVSRTFLLHEKSKPDSE
ncbi:MAG: hypothetical protein L0207_03160 [Chlamydiae bacterium]|nr:hypothetical protein [Chlamydiota bacterium]